LRLEEVRNLDEELNRIKKEAPLRLEDIYEFIKIIEQFNILKGVEFPKSSKELD